MPRSKGFLNKENLLGFGIVVLFILGAALWQSTGAEKEKPRDTAARIRLAKAEIDEIKAARSKNGKRGELHILDLLKPEVVLPVTLALVDDEYAQYGINRKAFTREIKANPEKFRQQVPEHRRSRFLLLTPELETRRGNQEEKKRLSEKKVCTDSKAQRRLNVIAEKIIAQLPVKPSLKVLIFYDDTVNACCLSNGTVIVHSALLKAVQNDDELAFVLAHEYAHFAARHGNESFTKAVFAAAGSVFAEDKEYQLEKEGKLWKALFLKIGYGGGTFVGFYLPYSRRMEKEADTLGLRYMTRAGYNPQAAITLWQRIGNTKDVSWAKYLSTHPEDKTRIEDMQTECDILLNKKGNAQSQSDSKQVIMKFFRIFCQNNILSSSKLQKSEKIRELFNQKEKNGKTKSMLYNID